MEHPMHNILGAFVAALMFVFTAFLGTMPASAQQQTSNIQTAVTELMEMVCAEVTAQADKKGHLFLKKEVARCQLAKLAFAISAAQAWSALRVAEQAESAGYEVMAGEYKEKAREALKHLEEVPKEVAYFQKIATP